MMKQRPKVFILRLGVFGFLCTISLGGGVRRPPFLSQNVGQRDSSAFPTAGQPTFPSSSPSSSTKYYQQYEQQQQQQQHVIKASLDTKQRTSFFSVVVVATANMLVNWYREDVLTPQVVRVPRVIWELVLMILALQATIAQQAVPGLYAILAIMLGSTAVGDLFFWAPMFAVASMFEMINLASSPRFLLLIQCLFVGFVYLFSTVTAWSAYLMARDEQKIQRELRARELWRQSKRR